MFFFELQLTVDLGGQVEDLGKGATLIPVQYFDSVSKESIKNELDTKK
jgi:hypothetical protein